MIAAAMNAKQIAEHEEKEKEKAMKGASEMAEHEEKEKAMKGASQLLDSQILEVFNHMGGENAFGKWAQENSGDFFRKFYGRSKSIDKEVIKKAFEQVGGEEAFIQWAIENTNAFYTLFLSKHFTSK